MRDNFIKILTQEAVNNPKIMLLTGDLGFKIFDDYRQKCPGQFLNVGVAEQNMVGLATGLALEGWIVFVYSIANFHTLRALEQIRNDICFHKLNVKIISVGGGFSYGAAGMSHHATEDLSILRALPNLRVLAPGDEWEAEELTKFIIKEKGPFYLSLDSSSAGNTKQAQEVFRFGSARQLRFGEDITLISSGGILGEVLAAADELKKEKINCRVLSVSCLKPFDRETIIKAVRETKNIITIEENVIQGGLGGAVAEACLNQGACPQSFKMMGIDNTFSSLVGSQQYLRQQFGLDKVAIISQVKKILK